MVHEPIESDSLEDEAEDHGSSQRRILPTASSLSRSQQMVVRSGASSVEDTGESDRQVNSSLDAVAHDDDLETVRAYSIGTLSRSLGSSCLGLNLDVASWSI